MYFCLRLFFFFSSRRRHTRLQGDWSSDVCSSDLSLGFILAFGCPIALGDSRQVGLFWRSEKPNTASGCPIGLQKATQVQFQPQSRAQQGKESSKAMTPAADPGAEPQQHIGQQRRPHLPAHRVGIVSQKVGQLQRLLDRSEEHTSELQSPCNLVCRLLLGKKYILGAVVLYAFYSNVLAGPPGVSAPP